MVQVPHQQLTSFFQIISNKEVVQAAIKSKYGIPILIREGEDSEGAIPPFLISESNTSEMENLKSGKCYQQVIPV